MRNGLFVVLDASRPSSRSAARRSRPIAVRLRSGQAVDGSFMSADVKIVRLLLDNGKIAEFPVEDVTALEFTPRKAPPAPAPDPAKTPPP